MFIEALFMAAKHGDDLNVYGQMNGYRCGVCVPGTTKAMRRDNARCSDTDAARDRHTK